MQLPLPSSHFAQPPVSSVAPPSTQYLCSTVWWVRLHLKLFLNEVKQQQQLSLVRTFLKVYSTISLEKLASYMEVDESTLRTILMTYKHRTHSVGADGKTKSNADIDFYIDDVKPPDWQELESSLLLINLTISFIEDYNAGCTWADLVVVTGCTWPALVVATEVGGHQLTILLHTLNNENIARSNSGATDGSSLIKAGMVLGL